jgi:hypothetical protein
VILKKLQTMANSFGLRRMTRLASSRPNALSHKAGHPIPSFHGSGSDPLLKQQQTQYQCLCLQKTSSRPLNRLSILINIFQFSPPLSNRVNRRLLRQDLPIRVFPDLGEFTPACKVGGVAFVALQIRFVSVRGRRKGGEGRRRGGGVMKGEWEGGEGHSRAPFRGYPSVHD